MQNIRAPAQASVVAACWASRNGLGYWGSEVRWAALEVWAKMNITIGNDLAILGLLI
jgi:hypothetical protein